MTKNQMIFGSFTVFVVAVIAITIAVISKDIAIKNAETQAEINAQTEIERVKIEETEATKRTKERMNWLPWY